MLNEYKNYLIGIGIPVLLIGTLALFGLWVNHKVSQYEFKLGAPTSTPTRNIIPVTDNKFDLGTSSPLLRWKNVFAVTASSTNLIISGLSGSTQCLQVNSVGTVSGSGSGCSGGGVTYDAWTHPFAVTTSATTSNMIFSAASSTFSGALHINGFLNASSSAIIGASSTIQGVLNVGGGGGTSLFNSSLSVLGSLTLGTALSAGNGGTGQSSYSIGDVLYASGASTLSKLTIGASSTILTVSNGLPAWTISPAFNKITAYDILSIGRTGTTTLNGDGASSTISGIINVGGVVNSASSTFNTGIKIKGGCYENATSTCIRNVGAYHFNIASSTLGTTTSARHVSPPIPITLYKVKCRSYENNVVIQLIDRGASPTASGTAMLASTITCSTTEKTSVSFIDNYVAAENIMDLWIIDAQPTANKAQSFYVDVYFEKN